MPLASQRRMDRQIQPSVRRRRLLLRLAMVAAPLAVAGWFLMGLTDWLRPSLDLTQLDTARVERGRVRAMVQASGTVRPTQEKSISSPVEARVLRILKRPGDRVGLDEEILELDTSESRLSIVRLEERLEQKRNEREEARLAGEAARAELVSRIESASLDHELARARLERSRKLHEEGLLSAETMAEAEVATRKAAIEMDRLKASLENRVRTTRASLARIRLEIEVIGKELDLERYQLELATTRPGEEGVLVWVVQQEGITVARGDVIARLARLDRFHVEARVSDMHASRIRRGAAADVEVAGTLLAGTVASIRPEVDEGTLRFIVELDAPDHPFLRQSMRVDVHVETEVREEVLRIPKPPFSLGGDIQEVFVLEEGRALRRRVRLGLTGKDHYEIEMGLAEGERVIVSDMREYRHLEEVLVED